MTSATHRPARRPVYGAVLAISLALTLLAGCERHRTAVEASALAEVAEPAPVSAAAIAANQVLVTEYEVGAMSARSAGEFVVCADGYAEAARASTAPTVATENWYEASRCAARAGDFRTSTFYLSSAASNGFAELPKLMTEPLFRPLYSGSRWDLVVEVVAANERARPAQALPLANEKPSMPICELIEHLRDRMQAPG